MKRIAAFVLVVVTSGFCSLSTYAQDGYNASRKAASRQQKASNKNSKQQQKAMKKAANAQRKALKQARKRSASPN